MSGLNQRFTKPSRGKTLREFESHILRKTKNPKGSFCFAERDSNGKSVRETGVFLWRKAAKRWKPSGFQNTAKRVVTYSHYILFESAYIFG
jgi:hypothetical protein